MEDARYLSIYPAWYILRKTRRDEHFDPPKLGDPPPTSELIGPWYHSHCYCYYYCYNRRHDAAVAYRSPPSIHRIIVLWKPCIKKGRGRLPTVPCVRFYTAGEGRLSTVPCVLFYITPYYSVLSVDRYQKAVLTRMRIFWSRFECFDHMSLNGTLPPLRPGHLIFILKNRRTFMQRKTHVEGRGGLVDTWRGSTTFFHT